MPDYNMLVSIILIRIDNKTQSVYTDYMTELSEKKVYYPVNTPDTVGTDVLVTIPYQYRKQRDIEITIRQPEFTSVCPMTGLPDFGCITIKYIPDQKIVELKSLKFYMLQYRNVGIFYEHLINHILNDLVAVVAPRHMEVSGNFTARGGITTEVRAVYEFISEQ
jgi:7-cyano-7-deazaguanine reductase